MKALGWYTFIFNILVIIGFILFMVDVIDVPPFTDLETIVWIVLSIPMVILGYMAIQKKA